MLLEHINLTVADLERSIAFYCELLGLRVRWQREGSPGMCAAAHVGNDEQYIALFQAEKVADERGGVARDYDVVGFNHFGFIVENLDERVAWLRTAGMTVRVPEEYDPGRRAYFDDPDGFEVELVEYVPAVGVG